VRNKEKPELNGKPNWVVPPTRVYDQNTLCCSVTFRDDFNPESDLAIVDILRPSEWGYFGPTGFPLRLLGDSGGTPDVRYSDLRHGTGLPDSTGYHGSVARSAIDDTRRRAVGLGLPWFQQAGVAAIDQAPTIAEQLRTLLELADKIGDPAQLLRVATEVETMITSLGPALGTAQEKIGELKKVGTVLSQIADLPSLDSSLGPLQQKILELKALATGLSEITEVPPLVQKEPPKQ
jgi:hypothetical protein